MPPKDDTERALDKFEAKLNAVEDKISELRESQIKFTGAIEGSVAASQARHEVMMAELTQIRSEFSEHKKATLQLEGTLPVPAKLVWGLIGFLLMSSLVGGTAAIKAFSGVG